MGGLNENSSDVVIEAGGDVAAFIPEYGGVGSKEDKIIGYQKCSGFEGSLERAGRVYCYHLTYAEGFQGEEMGRVVYTMGQDMAVLFYPMAGQKDTLVV